MKSIIGQKYIPYDNSHHLWLSRDQYNQTKGLPRPAGDFRKYPVQTVIVSEPYQQEILNVIGERKVYTFINVRYREDICRVLYREDYVNYPLDVLNREI